jgi:hypothetical protein
MLEAAFDGEGEVKGGHFDCSKRRLAGRGRWAGVGGRLTLGGWGLLTAQMTV